MLVDWEAITRTVKGVLSGDDIHPTEYGAQVLAQLIGNALGKAPGAGPDVTLPIVGSTDHGTLPDNVQRNHDSPSGTTGTTPSHQSHDVPAEQWRLRERRSSAAPAAGRTAATDPPATDPAPAEHAAGARRHAAGRDERAAGRASPLRRAAADPGLDARTSGRERPQTWYRQVAQHAEGEQRARREPTHTPTRQAPRSAAALDARSSAGTRSPTRRPPATANTGRNRLALNAAARSPWSRAYVARVIPQPGHHSPVMAWNGQTGNTEPLAFGSWPAT